MGVPNLIHGLNTLDHEMDEIYNALPHNFDDSDIDEVRFIAAGKVDAALVPHLDPEKHRFLTQKEINALVLKKIFSYPT